MEGLQDFLEVQRGIEGAREGAGELAELAFGAPCGTRFPRFMPDPFQVCFLGGRTRFLIW